MRKDVFHSCFRNSENFDYIIKKGDTFSSIAASFGVDIKDLQETNNFSEAMICPGQIIVVPQSGTNGALYFEEYVVEPSDRMNTIAGKCHVQLPLLMKYNDITKIRLAESQVVRIPKRRTYKIQEGDTLESILRKYNLSYERLIEANLKEWLRPGNKIIIE